jgi:hypothetical protein
MSDTLILTRTAVVPVPAVVDQSEIEASAPPAPAPPTEPPLYHLVLPNGVWPDPWQGPPPAWTPAALELCRQRIPQFEQIMLSAIAKADSRLAHWSAELKTAGNDAYGAAYAVEHGEHVNSYRKWARSALRDPGAVSEYSAHWPRIYRYARKGLATIPSTIDVELIQAREHLPTVEGRIEENFRLERTKPSVALGARLHNAASDAIRRITDLGYGSRNRSSVRGGPRISDDDVRAWNDIETRIPQKAPDIRDPDNGPIQVALADLEPDLRLRDDLTTLLAELEEDGRLLTENRAARFGDAVKLVANTGQLDAGTERLVSALVDYWIETAPPADSGLAEFHKAFLDTKSAHTVARNQRDAAVDGGNKTESELAEYENAVSDALDQERAARTNRAKQYNRFATELVDSCLQGDNDSLLKLEPIVRDPKFECSAHARPRLLSARTGL